VRDVPRAVCVSCLLVFDQPEEDGMYGSAIEMLEQVGNVVDSLYAKVSNRECVSC